MNKIWTYLRRVMPALATVALVAISVEGVSARGADDKPGTRRQTRQTSPFNLQASSSFLLSFNEWICGMTSNGEVCASSVGSSVGGGGFWPAGTANQYIFNSGLQIAGVVGPTGGEWAGDTLATFFFNASGPGSGVGVGAGIYSSTSPADLAAWPEDCFLDNPVFGRVKTLSEVDTCVQYWDGDPTAAHFTDSHPMGILVTQHSLLWSFPNNKDILFFSYKFKNVSAEADFRQRNPQVPAGGYAIQDIYAAFAMDPDVSVEYDENYATVVPELNLGTTWVYDFEADGFTPYAPNFDAAPGFVGVKFLQSPLNNSDEAITVNVGSTTRVVQPGEELGLTFFSVFTNGGIMSDAENAKQAYRYLSGTLSPSEVSSWCPDAPPGMCYVDLQAPDDMRFYQASGPFALEPGEEAEIVVAYMAGAPVPGTYRKEEVVPLGLVTDTTRQIEKIMGRGFNRPGFPSLFANAEVAQAIYDANFVLPAAPRSPTVTVIPGNRENTVVWTADPIEAVDPFAALAQNPDNALFDPNFTAQDFEGFRVYRRSNPAAEWQLIHQFDLANGIDEVVTVQQTVITASGDELIIQADTARVCRPEDAGCVDETGLQFSLVDRGGPFRAPENGPGLINGVRYFYAVTSFDINSPQSGPNSLESARVLSNEAQSVGAASGTPRSDAPTLTAGTAEIKLIGADGSELNPDAPLPTIDAEDGTFSGPMPPTNGFEVDISLIPALVTGAGEITVTVDSIMPGSPETRMAANYFMTAQGPAGTTQFEVPLTVGFSSTATFTAGASFPALRADASVGEKLGVDEAHLQMSGGVELQSVGTYGTGNAQRAAVNKVGPANAYATPSTWPRWFDSGAGEPADPTAGNFVAWCSPTYYAPFDEAGTECAMKNGLVAGAVTGFTVAAPISYSTLTTVSRGFEAVLGTLWRAADMELTWGANGAVESVVDLTHKVPVPFQPGIRGSWGFLTPASFAGVAASTTADKDNAVFTYSDFTCVDPVNEYAIARLFGSASSGCQSPVPAQLQSTAQIVNVNWVYPDDFTSRNWNGTGNQQQGMALYIAGQVYFFIGNQLPAAGTKWTLRSFTGAIHSEGVAEGGELVDYTNYVFTGYTRPPAVTGLRGVIELSPTTLETVTAASLEEAHVVPDPYYVTNILESSQSQKRIQFVNLPPEAVVRVFTLSGVLVAALEHNDAAGGGTLDWDLRSRNNQFLASGVYFYHIETPNGLEKVGKFTIIQYAQ